MLRIRQRMNQGHPLSCAHRLSNTRRSHQLGGVNSGGRLLQEMPDDRVVFIRCVVAVSAMRKITFWPAPLWANLPLEQQIGDASLRGRESQFPDRQTEIRGRKLILTKEPVTTAPKGKRSIDRLVEQRFGSHKKQSELRFPRRIGRLFSWVALAIFGMLFWINLTPGAQREFAAIAEYLIGQLLSLFD